MKPLKVLVVDDDDDLREIVREALEHAGMTTLGASNGIDGLAVLRGEGGHDIDVMLLDLMMPRMTGWEMRAEQLSDPGLAALPTIVMSAAANLTTRPISATAVVMKPVDLATLCRTIASVVARSP